MSYTPAWLISLPDRSDLDYYRYLIEDAEKDGVPDHVRENLINQYIEARLIKSLEEVIMTKNQGVIT